MCGLSLVVVSGVYSLDAVHGRLTAVASLVAEHRLYGAQASVVAAHGLIFPMAYGIFLDQVLCMSRQILNHWTTREVQL